MSPSPKIYQKETGDASKKDKKPFKKKSPMNADLPATPIAGKRTSSRKKGTSNLNTEVLNSQESSEKEDKGEEVRPYNDSEEPSDNQTPANLSARHADS